MLIRTYTTKSKFNRSRLHIEMRCNTCQKIFTSNRRMYLKKEHHWCSVECTNEAMKQGGLLHQKTKTTWLENHGVAHPMMSKTVRDKHQQTCITNHGVNSPLQIPHVHAAAHTVKAYVKKHQTHKRNGTYRQSYVETSVYTTLVAHFGVENVERHKRPPGTKWPIDLYVKPIDTWIQVDGMYWHGLDRPIEEIRRSTKAHDQIIIHKWEIDRAQDAWFAERNMRLIRVTDLQVQRAITNNGMSSLLTELSIVDASGSVSSH